jgi:2-oxoglutarate dehydrogenase E2 component (dihydrolipoamide succinyltransferase)
MATIEILLPKMGESVAEATITKWVVQPGQTVTADSPLVEIATDKVDSEVPAPEDGVLVEWLVQEGDVVQVGAAIARFSTGGADASTAASSAPENAAASVPHVPVAANSATTAAPAPAPAVQPTLAAAVASAPLDGLPSRVGASGRFYSPLVRSIAQAEGIPSEVLDGIPGTGAEGRLTKKDLLGFIEGRASRSQSTEGVAQPPQGGPAPAAVAGGTGVSGAPTVVPAAPAKPQAGISVGAEDEIVEMDRMRKLIADHMVRSVATSPHVTSFVEADVTHLVQWREKNKAAFEKQHGEKLTVTPLFAEAIVRAIRDFPGVNASVDGDRIILRKRIHLGMATALPSGNLIVPVIRDADQYNLVGLARAVNDLSARARANKLTPDDIAGGTYTMSNVGTFGNVFGTPIINQPQVGILALGAIRKRPAVLETPQGDVIAIRHMMFLSHSYDHRVVDGMLGGSFVRRVADYLEAFDPQRPVS